MISKNLIEKDSAVKLQYPLNSTVRIKHGGHWGVVVGYYNEEEFNYELRDVAVVVIKHYFGFEKEYAVDKVEPWVDVTIPSNLLNRFLCAVGFHSFEKEPSRMDIVKTRGINFIFWTFGVQKALKVCTRKGCPAEKKVWRDGVCGAGGISSKWEKLNSQKETEIDRMSDL